MSTIGIIIWLFFITMVFVGLFLVRDNAIIKDIISIINDIFKSSNGNNKEPKVDTKLTINEHKSFELETLLSKYKLNDDIKYNYKKPTDNIEMQHYFIQLIMPLDNNEDYKKIVKLLNDQLNCHELRTLIKQYLKDDTNYKGQPLDEILLDNTKTQSILEYFTNGILSLNDISSDAKLSVYDPSHLHITGNFDDDKAKIISDYERIIKFLQHACNNTELESLIGKYITNEPRYKYKKLIAVKQSINQLRKCATIEDIKKINSSITGDNIIASKNIIIVDLLRIATLLKECESNKTVSSYSCNDMRNDLLDVIYLNGLAQSSEIIKLLEAANFDNNSLTKIINLLNRQNNYKERNAVLQYIKNIKKQCVDHKTDLFENTYSAMDRMRKKHNKCDISELYTYLSANKENNDDLNNLNKLISISISLLKIRINDSVNDIKKQK